MHIYIYVSDRSTLFLYLLQTWEGESSDSIKGRKESPTSNSHYLHTPSPVWDSTSKQSNCPLYSHSDHKPWLYMGSDGIRQLSWQGPVLSLLWHSSLLKKSGWCLALVLEVGHKQIRYRQQGAKPHPPITRTGWIKTCWLIEFPILFCT